MFDALNFSELDEQQVELLPARTVLSMFTQGTDGGHGTPGADGRGTASVKVLGIPIIPGDSNGVGGPGGDASGGTGSGNGVGGPGGSANGGTGGD